MRTLACVLLAASVLAAQDDDAAARARAALDREDYDLALAEAAKGLEADPGSGVLAYLHADARCGRARSIQREKGFGAALAELEPHVGDHPLVTEAYARTALWAGEEERALRTLRAAVPEPRDRVALELELLSHLRRYGEAAERAREAGWEEGVVWASKRAALQERLAARARRGWMVAVAAAALLLGLAVLVFSLAPAARPGTS